jgi:hypothetical protein
MEPLLLGLLSFDLLSEMDLMLGRYSELFSEIMSRWLPTMRDVTLESLIASLFGLSCFKFIFVAARKETGLDCSIDVSV